MKIGLLICDHVKPKLALQFGTYQHMYHDVINAVDPTIEIRNYWVIDNQFPENIDECDAYIGTGSQYSVNHKFEWLENLKQLIRALYKNHKNFVGICFGHQLIAASLGGNVAVSGNGWGIGVAQVPVVSDAPFLSSLAGKISLRVSHQEQIQQLPEDSTILAGNDFCPIFMMQTGEHFMGIQGHPEFSADYAKALICSRQKEIAEATSKSAIESLKYAVDNVTIMQIAIQFLQQ